MFNYAIISFLLSVIFSCGKLQDTGNIEIISYSVDSVVIDSKGHIFDLRYLLHVSDYCQEDGFLYNYSAFDHSIEMIDLGRLELVEKFPLQKEGPDGTGSGVFNLTSKGNGNLFLASEIGAAIFTLEGKLLKKFDWKKISRAAGGITDEEYVLQQVANPYFEYLAFALVIDQLTNRIILKKLNTTDGIISSYEIDPEGNYRKYTLGDLTTSYRWYPKVFIASQQDKIIVSHEFSNDFYVSSPESEDLQQVIYASIHTPSTVTIATEGDFNNSIDDRRKALQSYREQVSFGPFVWDPQNKRYYRLSSSSTFGEEKQERRLLNETINVDVYLSVFDQEFNLISEMSLPELNNQSSAKYFVRDGMLWVFENRDDEMGFVRVIFD
ncbi:MAG TPA: DUF4221 family protein [Lunatimonas sp.]|nr:DUF4221 family protein [Lunatimonas sp.]